MIDVELTKLNESMAKMADDLGVTGNSDELRQFMLRQGGLLANRLLHHTAPDDINKTKRRIEEKVRGRMSILEAGPAAVKSAKFLLGGQGGKHGNGDPYWYAWSSRGLYGIASHADKRKASDDEVYKLFWRTDRKGRIRVGRRGRQVVYIRQRVTFKESQINRLVRRLQSHIGRLKAGWLPAWRQCGGPGRHPQKVALDHEAGARGYATDNLSLPMEPNFLLANTATGAGAKHMDYKIKWVLSERAESMRRDLQLYLRGVKTRAQLL